MKKIVLLLMALGLIQSASMAQTKVPQPVNDAFKQKFPEASKVKWEKETGDNYEAAFKIKGSEYSASFSIIGEWLETESESNIGELPPTVLNSFNTLHKGVQVKEVSKIELKDGSIQYEIEIQHGIQSVDLLYAVDGKELKGIKQGKEKEKGKGKGKE